jgi:hypothetical protein
MSRLTSTLTKTNAVALSGNIGFRAAELRAINVIVRENAAMLNQRWQDFHG